jgi:hypothetical protein
MSREGKILLEKPTSNLGMGVFFAKVQRNKSG